MKKGCLWLLLLSVLLILSYSCNPSKQKTSSEKLKYKVKKGDIAIKVNMTGTAEPYISVDIKSKTEGKIERLFVDKGDNVDKEQILIEVDESELVRKLNEAKTDLSIEELAVSDSKINLEDNLKELEKQKDLHQKGIVAKRQVEIAEKEYNLILNQHQSNEAKLLRAKEYYKKAKKNLDAATIKSPIAGTVIKNYIGSKEKVATGTITVAEGALLLTVGDLGKMVVKTNVNEIDVGKLQVSQPAQISFEAILDRIYQGKIIDIALGAESKTDTSLVIYPVTIEILNLDDKIIPGMTAFVEVIIKEKKDVLYVPIEAIVEHDGEKGVNLLQSGRVVFRPVVIGIDDANNIEIIRGLNENEEVVLIGKEE